MRLIFLVLAVVAGLASAQTAIHQLTIIPRMDSSSTGELRFQEKWSNGKNYIGFRAPSTIGANLIWQLPEEDGEANWCLVTNGAGALSFAACGSGSGSGDLPVVDTSSIVKGSVDATKAMRFEVDGITTATTRVLTIPNADVTLVGRENTETISGYKTFSFGQLDFNFLGAAADGKRWRYIQDTGGGIHMELMPDGYTYSTRVWTVSRTGATPNWIAYYTDVIPNTDSTYNLGGSANYWGTTFTKNINAAPGGILNNYTKVRKLEIADSGGGTAFWDIQARADSTSNSSMVVRDNSGNNVLEIYRAYLGVAQNYSKFYTDILPNQHGTLRLGSTDMQWYGIYALEGKFNTSVDTYSGYKVGGTTVIDSNKDATLRNVNITGACTGCAGDTIIDGTLDFNWTALAADSKRWRFVHDSTVVAWELVNDAYAVTTRILTASRSGMTVPWVAAHSDFVPYTGNAHTLGGPANYWSTAYAHNIDAAPGGVMNNYTKVRKLEIADDSGGSSFWDIQASASFVSGGSSSLRIRDNSGNAVVNFWRKYSGVPVDFAEFHTNVYPGNSTVGIGDESHRWNNVYASGVNTTVLAAGSIYLSTVGSDLTPGTTNVYSLGTSALRWKDLYVAGTATIASLNVTSCTGCSGSAPANMVTTDTSQTITAYKTFAADASIRQLTLSAAGTTAGTGTISGNLAPAFDGGGNIGSASLRWANGYFSGSVVVGGNIQVNQIITQAAIQVGASADAWVNAAGMIINGMYTGATQLSCSNGVKVLQVRGGIITSATCF